MLAAIWLGLAIVALGAIDVGNVYLVRRQLQRTADMAAMAGAQVISTPGGCAAAQSAAQANAKANGFSADGATQILTPPTCGRWDTSSQTYFSTSGNPLNAVRVQVTQKVPLFFLVGPPINVTATSTALASNIDAFTLGTGIASIDTQQSALLNAMLNGLLGGKSNINLSVGDTQSLAGAQIKLDDLRVALQASSMQGLLATSVSYQHLVTAMVKALQAGGDTANVALLQSLEADIPGGQNITIGDGGSSAPGLLALGLANANAAASASINVLDAVLAAAQIAQRSPDGSTANAPVINVTAGLAGVAGMSLRVINPPVLAVGEGGTLSDGSYRTQARTASINLSLTLQALPPLSLGIATIAVLSTPVVVNLAVGGNSEADLLSVDCENTKEATRATIQVTPAVASVCVAADASCTGTVNVASITLQGFSDPVAAIELNRLGPATASPGPSTLVIDGSSGSFDVTAGANSNEVGSDLATLTTQLFDQLPGALSPQIFSKSSVVNQLLKGLLTPILQLVTSTLSPLLQSVFSLLDTIVVPVLSLLGVQIGTATVHNMSLTCGVPQLVN